MKPNELHKELIKIRPGLEEFLDRNERKRNLALALRSIRKRAGLTQEQVAELTGMKQNAISKLESPSGPMPNTDTLHRYAEACGVVATVGFYGAPVPPKDPKKKVKKPRQLVSAVCGGEFPDEKFQVAMAPL
ncbi:helix-turn-helix domain-containing protein [Ruegeria atlantica]|uniref:helix-turn-helix domain-containing protein n=1 Tax=Ruegeria atlantica TaxID=81569 RepID=UPI00148000F7|nr:helix-turn-helix transcriptional regulator [Ruegeria atlantica]